MLHWWWVGSLANEYIQPWKIGKENGSCWEEDLGIIFGWPSEFKDDTRWNGWPSNWTLWTHWMHDHKKCWQSDEKIKPQGVFVSFKVPTEALPLDSNIWEEVVGWSITANSGMEQYIEQENMAMKPMMYRITTSVLLYILIKHNTVLNFERCQPWQWNS